MRMQQYKQEKKQEPLYEHLGGTSAKQLAKYGKPRSDGKSLSRVVKLTISSKSDYFLTADSGPGEENKTGLIVPKFGANPEQHVSVILSWRQLNELLLTTAEHYRAWLSAKYTAEWGAIHGPRINEREKKSSGRSKAQAPPQPAQDSASRKPPEQPVPPAQPPQSVQPARQVGFASVFGSIYGSGTGKSGAGDRRMF